MSPTTASHRGRRGHTIRSRSTLRTSGSDTATLRKYRSNGIGAVFAENAHVGIGQASATSTPAGSRVWRERARVTDASPAFAQGAKRCRRHRGKRRFEITRGNGDLTAIREVGRAGLWRSSAYACSARNTMSGCSPGTAHRVPILLTGHAHDLNRDRAVVVQSFLPRAPRITRDRERERLAPGDLDERRDPHAGDAVADEHDPRAASFHHRAAADGLLVAVVVRRGEIVAQRLAPAEELRAGVPTVGRRPAPRARCRWY